MAISTTSIVERIARVIAGEAISANASGGALSAADRVDEAWRDHLGTAMAVLRTLREADPAMAAAGDAATWRTMVDAALATHEQRARAGHDAAVARDDIQG